MKINSYAPYHIGIKLNPSIPIRELRQIILKNVGTFNMEQIAGEIFPLNVSSEILVKDADVRIEMNFVALALNTVGENPKKVTDIFEKVVKLLSENNYDLKSLAVFYELVISAHIDHGGDSFKILNKAVKCNITSVKDLVSDMSVEGIKFNIGLEDKDQDALGLIVNISPINPSKFLLIKISYQTRNFEKISGLKNTIEEKLLTIAKSLGED